MRSALWAAPCFLLLFMGCPYEAQDGESYSYSGPPAPLLTGTSQQLEMTRKAGAAPANVHATVELSDVAVARFSSLALKVNVYSGESLDAQGLRAQWLGEPGGEPVRANFSGEWSATWSADLYVASAPCTAAPCTLNLELAPEGQWNSELSFAMEYDVVALLELQGNYYPQLDSALELSLEAQP